MHVFLESQLFWGKGQKLGILDNFKKAFFYRIIFLNNFGFLTPAFTSVQNYVVWWLSWNFRTQVFDPLVSEIYPSKVFVILYAWTNPVSLVNIGEGHFHHWLGWLGMTRSIISSNRTYMEGKCFLLYLLLYLLIISFLSQIGSGMSFCPPIVTNCYMGEYTPLIMNGDDRILYCSTGG